MKSLVDSSRRIKIIRVCVALLCCLSSIQARSSVGAIVEGRAWIRFNDKAHSLQSIKSLKLPGKAAISHSLLQPKQCVAISQEDALSYRFAKNSSSIASLEADLLRTFIVEFDPSLSVLEFCRLALKQCPSLEYALPVYRNNTLFSPNDNRISSQDYLNTLQAYEAWDVTRGDSSIIIAICDNGVRISHEDLRNSLAVNSAEIPNNNIDDDGNGYIDDYNGYNFAFREDSVKRDDVFNRFDNHGTCVAGIAAATQNNGIGMSGVAGRCKFLPVKIGKNDVLESGLDYGYEGILYAAVRGAKVINCSWGNDGQGFNPLEQSVIDYATSRGSSVVVAAGNYDSRKIRSETAPFYPAAYANVLSVGEVTTKGEMTIYTSYGAHCHINAPGSAAFTVDNDNNSAYTETASSLFDGTSSACPMAAGVVALVRARFPALSPMQAMQHVRITGLPLESQNPTKKQFVTRMANAKNAVSRDPFSSASLRIIKTIVRDTRGRLVTNSSPMDTVIVSFDLKNFLGSASDLSFRLSAADPNQTNSVLVMDTVIRVSTVLRNASVSIASFPVIITQANTSRLFLRLDIEGKNEDGSNYTDFDLAEFYATRDFVTLSDSQTRFSLGDYGWIGSNEYTDGQRKGDGFVYSRFGNLLYRGGLVCTSTEAKVVSGIGTDGAGTQANDFSVVSRRSPWPYVLTITDKFSPNNNAIGVEIEQAWTLSPSSVAMCDLVVRNMSDDAIPDFAVGYFLDWDLSSLGDSCTVRRFTDAEIAGTHSVCEIEQRNPNNAVVGCMAVSTASDATPQAAGLNAEFTSANFPNSKKYEALNSGTSIQATGLGDMSMLVGMKFSEPIARGAERRIRFFIGAASTTDSLAKIFKESFTTEVSPDIVKNRESILSPMPVRDILHIRLAEPVTNVAQPLEYLDVIDLNGIHIAQLNSISSTTDDLSSSATFDLSEIPNGCYMVRAQCGSLLQSYALIVLH